MLRLLWEIFILPFRLMIGFVKAVCWIVLIGLGLFL